MIGKVIILVRSFKRKNHKIVIDFRQQALSHAMDQVLVPCPPDTWLKWQGLSTHITPDCFPPQLHYEEPPPDSGAEDFMEQMLKQKTRYDQAFSDTHKGNIKNFLAEDLIDSEIEAAIQKGEEFTAYLEKRGCK